MTHGAGCDFFFLSLLSCLGCWLCAVWVVVEMEVYARQCAANLKLWELRCTELTPSTGDAVAAATDATAGDSASNSATATTSTETTKMEPPTSTARRPEDYSTAFPLTLPLAYLSPHEDRDRVVHSPSGSSTSSGSSKPGHGDDGIVHAIETPLVCSPPSSSASPADSMNFFVVSPRTTTSSPKSAVGAGVVSGATAALRAAYEVSGRKR